MMWAIFLCVAGMPTCSAAEPPRWTPAYPLPWASETESKGHYGGERELVLADRSMFRIDKVIEEQHPGKPPGTKRHRVFVTYLGVPA